MGESESKPWYASTAIWGGLISILAPILGMFFGVSISADEQVQITNGVIAAISAGTTLVGGILAIIGRIKASKKIGK